MTGAYFTPDDFLNVTLTLMDAQAMRAEEVRELLQPNVCYTLSEMAEMLDAEVRDIVVAVALLVQGGAVFEWVELRGEDKGYMLVDGR